MKFTKQLFVGLCLSMALVLTGLGNIAKAEWTPQRPIEFVIMAGQGGGADRLARLIQSIIEKNDLSPNRSSQSTRAAVQVPKLCAI